MGDGYGRVRRMGRGTTEIQRQTRAEEATEVHITKTGSAPIWDVTARGFLGDPNNELTGSFDEATGRLVISGSYPEDPPGITTTTHDLTATSDSQMVGTETWNWDDGAGGTCTGSLSSVTATRVP